MEQYFYPNNMEFYSSPCDPVNSTGGDSASIWSRLESPKGFKSHSFSVLYQAFDFPFPSIQCQTQCNDQLDSQFSVGCVHGSGSMLASLDMNLDRCFDEARCSVPSDLPVMVNPKEDMDFMTPNNSQIVDDVCEPDVPVASLAAKAGGRVTRAQSNAPPSGLTSSAVKTRHSAQSILQHPHVVGTKEPNPVEFRSGYRGVSWNRRMKAWLAFWSEGKNRRSKTFNAKVMGFDKARASAIDFLKKKKQFLQQLDPTYNDFCDDDEYNEGGSLADSATTTSDTPTGSVIDYCSICGMANASASESSAGGSFLVSECVRCNGVMSAAASKRSAMGVSNTPNVEYDVSSEGLNC